MWPAGDRSIRSSWKSAPQCGDLECAELSVNDILTGREAVPNMEREQRGHSDCSAVNGEFSARGSARVRQRSDDRIRGYLPVDPPGPPLQYRKLGPIDGARLGLQSSLRSRSAQRRSAPGITCAAYFACSNKNAPFLAPSERPLRGPLAANGGSAKQRATKVRRDTLETLTSVHFSGSGTGRDPPWHARASPQRVLPVRWRAGLRRTARGLMRRR